MTLWILFANLNDIRVPGLVMQHQHGLEETEGVLEKIKLLSIEQDQRSGDVKETDVIAQFKSSGLPSRADRGQCIRFTHEQLLIILRHLQGQWGTEGDVRGDFSNIDLRRDYRKLREFAIQGAAPPAVHASIGEASAKYSLWMGDWAEFMAASKVLIQGPYREQKQLRSPWIYLSHMLVQWSGGHEEAFAGTFYTEYEALGEGLLRTLVDLVLAANNGNIVRYDAIASSLTMFPGHLAGTLRSQVLARTEDRFRKAYKCLPEEFLAKLTDQPDAGAPH